MGVGRSNLAVSWDAPGAAGAAVGNPQVVVENAKIVRPRRFNLEHIREAYRLACKAAIEVAFGDTSRHAVCQQAHRKTGIDPEKFRRILDDSTKTPDPVLMGIVAGFYLIKTGKLCPAMALLNQLAGVKP